ncbi:hypothetical protein [Nocardia sp. NPDC005998]|uniref:hypothetical protein n=1 Tax=Nocardia sp. NPDC005998 TaxID=3156894 RepID=UPI0033AD442E
MSSRPHLARDTIPPGDVELHDNYLPGLQAGNYSIEVTHDLLTGTGSDASSIIEDGKFHATQQFTVRGPQISIDPGAVLAKQPADSSSGQFDRVLPHVVLGDPMLPWERTMAAKDGTPWLALLVLTEDQLVGAITDRTRTINATVQDFLAKDSSVLKPALSREPDIATDSPCCYIQVTADAFRAVTPRLTEAHYLTHARGANTADRPILGIAEDGLFSVVVASRFPTAGDAATGTKNIVHLVSLEGHEKMLVDNPNFGGHSSVALLSLCSWSFWCYSDPKGDFRELAEALACLPNSATRAPAEQMWLRLSSPYPDTTNSTAPQRQVARRLNDGFVPLPYSTRSGESTYAWYRGPFTPVVPAATPQAATATSSDALIGYDPAWGSFDVSLASAFEMGRALAVGDSAFAQDLMVLKRAARGVVDKLYQQYVSTHLPAGAGSSSAVAAFGAMLNGNLMSTLGKAPARPSRAWTPPAPVAPPPDQHAALAGFLDSPQTRAALQSAIGQPPLSEHLAPIAAWLGQRILLYGVPFTQLVPQAAILPVESLRFFHLDWNWLNALVSGALSIGSQSSRDGVQDRIVGDYVRVSATQNALAHRDESCGVAAHRPRGSADAEAPQSISGFLLRSAIVSGWPNLAVRGYDPAGKRLPILRMDHLSPNVLLCLFEGIPSLVELREPQEGFRFGVDDEGYIPLRNLLPSKDSKGSHLGDAFPDDLKFSVFDNVRSGLGYRVLDLSRLVPNLECALADAHKRSVAPVGPADLALQMVRVPESIGFEGPDRS